MGSSPSVANGRWQEKDTHSLKNIEALCDTANVDVSTMKGYFHDHCDHAGRVTRMQVLWGCDQFHGDGLPKPYITNSKESMSRSAAFATEAAKRAACAANIAQTTPRDALAERQRREEEQERIDRESRAAAAAQVGNEAATRYNRS